MGAEGAGAGIEAEAGVGLREGLGEGALGCTRGEKDGREGRAAEEEGSVKAGACGCARREEERRDSGAETEEAEVASCGWRCASAVCWEAARPLAAASAHSCHAGRGAEFVFPWARRGAEAGATGGAGARELAAAEAGKR